MYKWFSTRRQRYERQRSGVTLVEILIVTVVIALMAAVSFPVYKIIQQREKEKRLRAILYSVRSAIAGSKSALSITSFFEGHRNYVIAYGKRKIEELDLADDVDLDDDIATISTNFTKIAAFGPSTPQQLLESNYTITVDVDTGDAVKPTFTINIPIDRRFLRHIPPHPFVGWIPDAHFEFKPKVKNGAVTTNTLLFDDAHWGVNASGVADIVSRGAGLALNGSRTDDW